MKGLPLIGLLNIGYWPPVAGDIAHAGGAALVTPGRTGGLRGEGCGVPRGGMNISLAMIDSQTRK